MGNGDRTRPGENGTVYIVIDTYLIVFRELFPHRERGWSVETTVFGTE